MSITTKTGDKGSTGLFGGRRVKKYDLQVEAYGAIDEATCFIGSAFEVIDNQSIKQLISEVQFQLYIIMGYLADAGMKSTDVQKHLKVVEKEIQSLEKSLPKLTRFILPQGSEQTSRLQIARASVRSAERRVVAYVDQKPEETEDDILILKYLNRLSDLFFMLARKYAVDEKRT
jgi:cob(I)alamin adenosyltransferase